MQVFLFCHVGILNLAKHLVLSISSDSGMINFHLSNTTFPFMFIMRRQNIIIDRTFTSSSEGSNFKVTLQS